MSSDSIQSALTSLKNKMKSVFEAKANKVTSESGWSGTVSDDKYPSEKLVKDSLDDKISKSQTVGLVKNDGQIDTSTYLTEHQDISGKANSADLARVATTGSYGDLSGTPTLADVATSGDYGDLDNRPNLATVATSGNYNDLTNKPTIPTDTSDLTNGAGFLTTHQDISGKSDVGHAHAATEVTDANAANYTSIGTLSADATQQAINAAVNSKLSALASVEAYVWDTAANDGTPSTSASASTMNKLYLIKATNNNDDNYDVFVTKRSGTSGSYTYAWEKIDSVTLDISGKADANHSHAYSEITSKPSFTQDSGITSSTTGRYAIGTINISGESQTIYGVDTNDATTQIIDAVDYLTSALDN